MTSARIGQTTFLKGQADGYRELSKQAAAAVRRLRDLLKAGRILSSDLAVRSPHFDPEFRAALLPARTEKEIVAFDACKNLLSVCIKEVGRTLSPMAIFDAEAMARLSIANERLETITSDTRRPETQNRGLRRARCL